MYPMSQHRKIRPKQGAEEVGTVQVLAYISEARGVDLDPVFESKNVSGVPQYLPAISVSGHTSNFPRPLPFKVIPTLYSSSHLFSTNVITRS
jgi:hypothetical protein